MHPVGSFSRIRPPRNDYHKSALSAFPSESHTNHVPHSNSDARLDFLRYATEDNDDDDGARDRIITPRLGSSSGAGRVSHDNPRNVAISNVGENGTIYLKYEPERRGQDTLNQNRDTSRSTLEERPPIQSAYPPTFGLPPSPPMSPYMSTPDVHDAPRYWHDGLHESAAAAAGATTLPNSDIHDFFSAGQYRTLHQQPSIQEQRRGSYPHGADSHGFDPTRLHPGTIRRHSHSGRRDSAQDSPGMLQVSIPTHRIGNPRFSARGGAYLTNSIYTAVSASTRRSSAFSDVEFDQMFPSPPGKSANSLLPRLTLTQAGLSMTPAPTPPEATFGVDPRIYDIFAYDSENPKYIRYLPSGQILAASPARLVTQITHVRFLDYELLSDFFLTYRAFLSPCILLRFLIARLRWAVFGGAPGRVVRVRTFVAVRHWILNYFMDDFEPHYEVRSLFCDLVNALANDLYARPDKGRGDLQVVGELKKCWRRTCDVVWGTSDGARSYPATHDIVASGKNHDHAEYELCADAGVSLAASPDGQDYAPEFPSPPPRSAQPASAHPLPGFVHQGLLPATSAHHSPPPRLAQTASGHPLPGFVHQGLLSSAHRKVASMDPAEMASLAVAVTSPSAAIRLRQDSLDVTSCSIPMWSRIGRYAPSFRPKTLMPVEESGRIEATRHGNSFQGHMQGKSSKDGPSATLPYIPAAKHEPFQLGQTSTLNQARSGDLIRGILIRPPDPAVTKQVPAGPLVGRPVQLEHRDEPQTSRPPMPRTNTARRMLSFRSQSRAGSRAQSREENRRVDTPQMQHSQPQLRAKVPLKYVSVSRSDMLAVRVAKAYEKLLRGEPSDVHSTANSRPPSRDGPVNDAAASSIQPDYLNKGLVVRPPIGTGRSKSHITTGSRSIVIMDDTGYSDTRPSLESDIHDRLTPVEDREVRRQRDYFAARTGHQSQDQVPTALAIEIPYHDPQASMTPRAASNGTPTGLAIEIPYNGPQAPAMRRAMSPSSPSQSPPQKAFLRVQQAPATLRYRASDLSGSSGLSPGTFDGLLLAHHSNGNENTDRGTVRRSSAVDVEIASDTILGGQQQLRRKPGGYLKDISNLKEHALRRRNSTGSISPQTRSATTSATVSSGLQIEDARLASKRSRPRLVGHGTDGNLSSAARKKSLSLLSTLSDRPHARPSFEAEAAKLRRMEDTEEDDGGIESTLAKLEGRSPSNPASPKSVHSPTAEDEYRFPVIGKQMARSRVQVVGHPNHPQTSRLTLDDSLASPQSDAQYDSITSASRYSPDSIRGRLSQPLHTSGLSSRDELGHRKQLSEQVNGSRDLWSHVHAPIPRRSESSQRNWPLVQPKGFSLEQQLPSARTSAAQSSFLLDDNESLDSDDEDDAVDIKSHKSKPSQDISIPSDGDHSFFLENEGDDDDDSDNVITPGPALFGAYNPPLSPPPSHPLPALPFTSPRMHQPMPDKAAQRLRTPGPPQPSQPLKAAASFPMPPTPRFNNTDSRSNPNLGIVRPIEEEVKKNPGILKHQNPPLMSPALAPKASPPSHTPFILAFSSEVLAQQFTIIERDALAEIDWKELIDLKWQATPTKVRNWAEYMRTPTQSGVDIVIARFNLVVKWAVSEILLCENTHDRARTISKLIHIAAHARRLRNYATTYQLTVALLSTSIARLSTTWSLISQTERSVLAHLEVVVQPVRNFARLRQEMEQSIVSAPLHSASTMTRPATAASSRTKSRARQTPSQARQTPSQASSHHSRNTSVGEEDGYGACIPFIGVYTHDLAFNAQKPAFVDSDLAPVSTSTSEIAEPSGGLEGEIGQMVNFERFQTAASVVKGLLRLLEASGRYVLRPDEEVLARCLWLAALSDEEICERGKEVEAQG